MNINKTGSIQNYARPQQSAAPKSEETSSGPKDSFVTNVKQFGLGATPVIGTLTNGMATVVTGFGEMIGGSDLGFGKHFLGTIANIGGTTAVAVGLVSGMLPVTIAGAGLLAGSGLAFASA